MVAPNSSEWLHSAQTSSDSYRDLVNPFSRSSSVLSPPFPRLFLSLYCSNCGKTDADFNFGTRAGGERHQIPQKRSLIHGNTPEQDTFAPSAPTPLVFRMCHDVFRIFCGDCSASLWRPGDSGDKTNHSAAQLPQSNPLDLGSDTHWRQLTHQMIPIWSVFRTSASPRVDSSQSTVATASWSRCFTWCDTNSQMA